ncbi:hypothetical protein [Marinobacterium lutimaris]|uniref:Uncharacterized protein n=1 Tax=Marinobacterium lutimaris TaxID=568106 RepID=A0A1H5UST8_9GAMM|nr:hypothetical protein [Marinobacterium lutimaris]SEF78133.1 hypothetical protein SAMN05444390_101492 [Marinobacterium lutimaris]
MTLRSLLGIALFSLAGCSSLPSPDGSEAGGQQDGGYLNIETLTGLSSKVVETSGLALHAGRIWTINDSGNGPWLYELDEYQGEVVKRVRVADAVNIDWESMAADERYLYVADCGNNSGRREWLQLYRINWQQLLNVSESEPVASQYVEFSLADPGPVQGVHKHDNDCEAVTVVGSELWLFIKGWLTGTTRLYKMRTDIDNQAPVSTETWPVQGLITAADYSADRKELVLLGYTLGRFSSDTFLWRVPVVEGQPDWSAARYHDLWPSGQWEGIAWRGDELLLTREKSILGEARLGRIQLAPRSRQN